MAQVTIKTDTVVSIVRANQLLPLVGFDSKFTTEPHTATGKKVEGWIWDTRAWADVPEVEGQDTAPSIWDPDNSPLNKTDFQSGVGDRDELKADRIIINHVDEKKPWSPEVQHGYYYDFETESYLFSDGGVTQIFSDTVNAGGSNFVDLTHTPKPGVPIMATKYKWDAVEGVHKPYVRFTKKVDFSGERDINGFRLDTRDNNGDIIYANIDTSLYEFVVESDVEPQQAILNGDHVEDHGGIALADMEVVGIASGEDNEEFNTLYSPITIGGESVKSFYTTAGPATVWTIVEQFTGIGNQCILDYDLGVVRFAASPASHPAAGETIAVSYKSSVALEYEAQPTPDTIVASELNVNPLDRSTSKGFVFLKNKLLEPDSIHLEAVEDLISPDFYGPAFLGEGTQLEATVLSAQGEAVDGVEVTFQILNGVGEFSGGASSATAVSDASGVARTTLVSPRDVRTLGAFTSSVVHNGGNTELTIDVTNLVGNSSEWYIYKVFNDDPALGITDLNTYYADYLAEEGITGPTAVVPVDPTESWEHVHRFLLGLLTPTEFNPAIRNGRKQLLITWDPLAINPHNNPWNANLGTGAFVPMRPTSVVFSGTQTIITVTGEHEIPGDPGSETLAAYFVVAPTVAQIQATAYNERLRITMSSNEIELEMRVPPSMDGTVLVDVLNEQEKLALLGVGEDDPPLSGQLPLGFRIKSAGVNLAACVDGLTYFDVNETLHDTDTGTDTGTNSIAHAFTVRNTGS